MSTPAIRYWRVFFAVRPKPAHPKYWEVQCGTLAIWVPATDDKSAGALAERVFAALDLYEMAKKVALVSTEEQVAEGAGSDKTIIAELLACSDRVREDGLALFFRQSPVGEDEVFCDQPWPKAA